jgi:hypothetical protein
MAPTQSTNISFWNSRGLGNKKLQLEEYLHSKHIDFMAICESKFNVTTNQVYKNYNLLHQSNFGGAEGIAILPKRNLPYTVIQVNLNAPTPKVMACSYNINKKNVLVILIYSAPNKPLSKTILKEILNQATTPTSDKQIIILGGDFNAHHTAWGNSINNKGREIMDFADEHNLLLLNDGQVTRLGMGTQQNSSLDLTFVLENIRLECEWCVCKDSMGSDHLPINTTISWAQQSTTQPCLTNRKRNFKQADWTKYTALIEESLSFRDSSVPLIYTELEVIISSAADSSIPYIKTPNSSQPGKHPYVSWWTEECSIAVKNTKNATKEVLKNGNEQTVKTYQKQIRETRNILRKAKKEGWQKYTQTFNATTPTKVIWDKVKAFQKGRSRPQRTPEGSLNLTSYHKHACPDYVPEEKEVTPNLIASVSQYPNHPPFTLQELNDVIRIRLCYRNQQH